MLSKLVSYFSPQTAAKQRINQARKTNSTRLDLDELGLTSLPPEIGQLTNLTLLSLWRNDLTSLPPELWQLTNLTFLNLGSNQLTSLPPEIGQLTNLTWLSLWSNQLASLPPELWQLTNLTSLHLWGNDLTSLPPEIGQLTNLTILNLGSNQLTNLPPELWKLTNLTSLDLGGTKLTSLPSEIGQLTNLTNLGIKRNQLTSLPPEIGQLTNLDKLELDGNSLTGLPPEIVKGGGAAILNYYRELSSTPKDKPADLESDPKPIVQPELESTSAAGTLAKSEPASEKSASKSKARSVSISKTKSASKTELESDLKPIVQPELESTPAAVTSATAESAPPPEPAVSPPPEYLYEAKLVLVGEGRVGKTSLLKSLIDPHYQLQHDEQSTRGIEVHRWVIPQAEIAGAPQEFHVNIWDFGGQEIYHATHQFFMSERAVYLLVTESRREDTHEDFFYWLNLISTLAKQSPVVIVLNKIDQPTKELPIAQYRERFANVVDFERVSCQPEYQQTIDILKTKIKNIIATSKFGQSPMPAHWVRVRRVLEERALGGADHISYDEYLTICEEQGQRREGAGFLCDFLHNLGAVLHFGGDMVLQDTIILNHDWVTTGVYKILDHQPIKDRQGEFTDADLSQIWNEPQYRTKRPQLLALMKRFELCYELVPGRYLAPQMLPVDAMSAAQINWRNHNDTLRFEFRYTFMPKGIVARLIVKQFAHICDRIYWRYGVLLEWQDTRALVREDYLDRKISITLEGVNKRDLLTMIRGNIEAIHAEFENLDVTAMIPCNCDECRTSGTPEFFEYATLHRYQDRGKKTIECRRSLDGIPIASLLSDFEPGRVNKRERRILERRLQVLREQAANFGYHMSPHIAMEIEEIEAKLNL